MSEETKRGRGRPPKGPIPYDEESVKDFVKRYFELEREKKILMMDQKELKQEFKDKIDQKLLSKVIKLVKTKVQLEEEAASPDTVEEMENIVRDKINMVL